MTEVQTTAGIVRGTVVDGVASFKGVPFAAPPVGARRFQAPAPPQPWDGVRDALDYGHTAPQGDYPPPLDKLLTNFVNDGDDYLNLNVWTPEQAIGGDPRPVMVWIHGGAFVNGSGAIYDGTTFARDGVVMVSINYRLGVNGFLWFGEGTPNLGILDQIAALEWVRDNIAAFGGDPAKVTIFGESAGGMSTATLLATPAAHGLFGRAIVQSGGGHIAMSPGSAIKVARKYAKILGVEPSREAVAAADPKAIIAAQSALSVEMNKKPFKRLWGDAAANLLPFEPVIDGTIVPGLPETAIAAGASADVDLMVGSNAHEGRLFLAPTGAAPKVPPVVPYIYARTAGAKKPAATLKAYRKSRSTESWGDITASFMTDAYFRAPALRLAEAHPGTFVYEFQWETPQVPGLGSCHALEVPFVFDGLDGSRYAALTGPSAPKDLAAAMHKAWIDFAVTGDPGWPAYDHTTRSTMVFNKTSGVEPDPRPHDRRHWER
ncbi:MAG: carboxylesterase/lipase family protein [Gordonia sp.]|mgnify:FL=1|jgi:para-nitrobenzyl esterase|uniref:carboxylesterase/lipase family protein n=1 Tax=Gordonia sp. (in: high G+C Gram-positive bacteria) TaxID=84139 RepID=UPI001D905664|nr:carboxylesterase family protein [Gordonia sp. (in: high G+C Gram-positive bacteria)]MCB1294475.1 carboxylesterase/lipase family protein [Gordonia sp. (in: high G+C Gram-positive bacteria)]HMS76314.1 carboxylesterase family protein [Gordonia sp. (in: high G+C Gram-positive bacteria)]